MLSIKINVVLAYCTLRCFQYSLQSTLELVLILFTTNTRNIIKKMFLDMIMSISQKNININGRRQTNKYKRPNVLFLQRYDQSQRFRTSLVKIREKALQSD